MFNKLVKLASVNEKTKNMAQPEAVAQLGLVLNRMIHTISKYCHHDLPIKFAKLDVKDVLWRMELSNKYACNLCYVLPSLKTTTAINDIEIFVPNSLQIGWCESPPFFFSGSKTARDLMGK